MKREIRKLLSNVLGALQDSVSDAAGPDSSRKKGLGQRGGGKGRSKDSTSGKKGLPETLSKLSKNPLASAAMVAAAETGMAVLNRPGVKASLDSVLSKLLTGKCEQDQSIKTVDESADRIASILQNLGLEVCRLGIDGLPGSGKSTLARALAGGLGMQWKSLDHQDMNAPRDFSQDRTVYEHHRLFRTQDVDVFDAIIYVDEPVETARAHVIERGRGGVSVELFDFDKLKKIGALAFDLCEGEPIPVPDSQLTMKVRGSGGFCAAENLASRLKAAGYNPTVMKQEEMLFLLAYGELQYGVEAYILPGAFNEELLKGLLAGTRRILGD